MEYKVRENIYDNNWQVIFVENRGYMEDPIETIEFEGNLSDCEAFIRLKENGYFD